MGECLETFDASTTFKAEKHETSTPNSISYDIKADFLICVIIEAQWLKSRVRHLTTSLERDDTNEAKAREMLLIGCSGEHCVVSKREAIY
jgi:hypothetical protein